MAVACLCHVSPVGIPRIWMGTCLISSCFDPESSICVSICFPLFPPISPICHGYRPLGLSKHMVPTSIHGFMNMFQHFPTETLPVLWVIIQFSSTQLLHTITNAYASIIIILPKIKNKHSSNWSTHPIISHNWHFPWFPHVPMAPATSPPSVWRRPASWSRLWATASAHGGRHAPHGPPSWHRLGIPSGIVIIWLFNIAMENHHF